MPEAVGRDVVVPFSTGRQSFAAAVRAREKYDGVRLLFADVKVEDTDNYRFLREAAQVLGLPVHVVADGRTPWGVAFDEHMIPNSKVPLCSRRLKHEPSAAWMEQHAPDALVVTGVDWDEKDRRLPGIIAGHAPREVWAPLCEPPYLFARDYDALIRSFGIEPPRMYEHGYAHANCAGACFRAGISAWVHLLRDSPALYAENERQEQAFRALYGDHAILRHRSGPKEGQPLPLAELRGMVEQGATIDMFDWGGCGCMPGDLGEVVLQIGRRDT